MKEDELKKLIGEAVNKITNKAKTLIRNTIFDRPIQLPGEGAELRHEKKENETDPEKISFINVK